jgi:hypothetical protein
VLPEVFSIGFQHYESAIGCSGLDCGWEPAIRSPSLRDMEKRSAIGIDPSQFMAADGSHTR